MLPMAEDTINTRIFLFVWTCTSLSFISYSAAFSHGASLAACSDMRPKHIRAAPQNMRKNYITVHANRSFYLPGDKVPVTVRSARDFMGFMLQARRISNDQVAGSFIVIPTGSKLLHCFQDGDTVTHSDKSLKRNLSFVWKSPDQPVGDIKFFLSVVQSYFVYWARIESAIVSQHVQNQTFEVRKPEKSSTDMMTVSGLVTNSTIRTVTHPSVPGLHKDTSKRFVEFITSTASRVVTYPSGNNLSGTVGPSHPEYVPRISLQSLQPPNEALNQHIHNRTQNTSEASICLSCEENTQDFTVEFTLPTARPTYSADPGAWITIPVLPTEETRIDPLLDILEDTDSTSLSPSTTQDEELEATEEISANFLHHSEDVASDMNVRKAEVTIPWVTNTIPEAVDPGKGGESKTRGMQLAMTQLGILLGCSAVLGMALAAGLRCIHAQYCHKRTEVSFSEPDNNIITLRENGEMMQFRKIRENSFVLVQAEYNWIAPAGKTQ
ncbi:reelin domain-containing protein 1 [Spea bombifrons]|uniref:reelin domain-containing protein 1 n=1 Tax=Spea bombifrons TaxID=233779 RepID=UPI0023495996|nr:reelin domain-containing protein 1 [Spea bombifrons]